MYYGGYVTPFDLANVVLVMCMFYVSSKWSENFGKSDGQTGGNFGKAMQAILEDQKIFLCGLICSSFESSMFIFVFNWTPCLMEPGQPVPPFGHIFTGFMISGFVAALAGVINTLERTAATPTAGSTVLLASFAAAIIGGVALKGGRGSVIGTLIGALSLGLLQIALALGAVQQDVQQIFIGGVLLLAVVTDPASLRAVTQNIRSSFGGRRANSGAAPSSSPPVEQQPR